MNVFDLSAKLVLDKTEYDRNLAAASADGATFGDKLVGVGSKLTMIGSKLSVVSAGVVALGAAAVKAFEAVDEGADNVIKKTGATGEAAEELAGVYEKVATSVVGDFSDIGNVVGEINTRFKITGDELESLSEEFMKFATINDVDATSAVQSVDMALKTFNVDSSETENVMGLLTKTAQDTGISMDTLTGLLQSSGAQLQEMGLSIDESITLMGTFESAGIDSSTMLAKMAKAAVYYQQEGKSMNEGLSSLITRLQDSSTEAEATAEAYEVFGSRAGLQFVTFAKQGKISLDNLSQDLSQYSDVVSDTYEETLDGTDKLEISLKALKVAFGKVGNSISDTLAPIADKLTAALQKLSKWFDSLTDEQKELAVKIGLVVAAEGPLLVIVGKLLTSIKTVTTATKVLFGVMSANPIGALVAAIGVALVVAKKATDEIEEQAKAEYGLNEAEKERIETIREGADALDEEREALKELTEEASSNAKAEQALYEELQTMVDANGKIKEGYEDRAETVAQALSDMLGVEVTVADGVIEKWDELGNTIDEVIQKQLSESIAGDIFDKYKNAYSDATDYASEYNTTLVNLAKAEKKLNEVEDDYISVLGTSIDMRTEWNAEHGAASDAVDEETEALENLAYQYGYNSIITQDYYDLQAAMRSGDADQMDEVNKRILEHQSWTDEQYIAEGKALLNETANGLYLAQQQFGITADEIEKSSGKSTLAINDFLTKLGEASGDAEEQAELISQGIRDGLITEDQANTMGENIGYQFGVGLDGDVVQTEVGDAVDDATGKITELDQSSNSWTWGNDLISNLASGINSAKETVSNAVSTVAGIIYDFLHFSEPDVGPLSNFHTYMPDMIDLMVKGIKGNKRKVISELDSLAGEMQTAITNPELSTKYGSLTTLGGVNITVYGAEGQDTYKLAQEVSEIIANQYSRRTAVYA